MVQVSKCTYLHNYVLFINTCTGKCGILSGRMVHILICTYTGRCYIMSGTVVYGLCMSSICIWGGT